MPNFLEALPEDVRTTIPQDIAEDKSLANYNSIDELLRGHIELSKKQASSGDWISSLPEDQKALVQVKGWKSPSDPIKGYASLEKLVGHDKIAMPKKDQYGNYEAGELERVMAQLGRPKDPKEYKESANFKLPEGLAIDAKVLDELKNDFHKAGFLPSQYALVMDKLAATITNGLKAQKEQNEKQHNEAALNLRAKLGMAYEQHVKVANSMLNSYLPDSAKDAVKKYGNDPIIIELLGNIGKNLSEEALANVGMSGVQLTPEAAKLEIQKIRAERSKELNDAGHPQHKFWLDKLDELYKMVG